MKEIAPVQGEHKESGESNLLGTMGNGLIEGTRLATATVKGYVQDQPSLPKAKTDGSVIEFFAQGAKPASQTESPAAKSTPGPECPREFDPKFQKTSSDALAEITSSDHGPLAADAFKELIVRRDATMCGMTSEAMEKSIGKVHQRLKDGKSSESDIVRLHSGIMSVLDSASDQVKLRQDFARLQRARNQDADAEKLLIEAKNKADEISIPLVKQEGRQLWDDMPKVDDPDYRRSLQKARMRLLGVHNEGGTANLSLDTRRDLIAFYLGAEYVPSVKTDGSIEGVKEIKFGAAHFNPEKAFELAQEFRTKHMEIQDVDPLTSNKLRLSDLNPQMRNFYDGKTPTNLFQITEELSGKRFDVPGLVRPEEFSSSAISSFDKFDSNGDGFLSNSELDLDKAPQTKSFTEKERQIASAIRDTPELEKLSRDEWFLPDNDGATKKDLEAFAKLKMTGADKNPTVTDVERALWFEHLRQ